MTESAPPSATTQLWWGNRTLHEGAVGFWHIGPLRLWIENLAYEWRVHSLQGDNPLDDSLEVYLPTDLRAPAEAAVTRFSFSDPGTNISLTPRLADRAIVVKPEVPFYVPSGGEATLYVTTPLWVELSIRRGAHLGELPSFRPSDTWFGATTLVGELCYASRTVGRLTLEGLQPWPHRAITPVRVRNRAETPLLLEKVKLPVQYLSVHASSNAFLWTEQVTLERQEDGDLADLQVGKLPRQVGRADKLSSPRQHAEKNLVVRAFSKLFQVS